MQLPRELRRSHVCFLLLFPLQPVKAEGEAGRLIVQRLAAETHD